MRIVNVNLLLDVGTDAEASDFCSETFSEMPYVVDWSRGDIPANPMIDEYSIHYVQTGIYLEGDFLSVLEKTT